MSRVSHRGDEKEPYYHKRFRERFPYAITDFSKEPWGNVMNDILAFIDEVVAEASLTTSRWAEGREMGHRVGFYDGKEAGRAEERADLASKVEGMKRKSFEATGEFQESLHAVGFAPPVEKGTKYKYMVALTPEDLSYNQALDDLLTHLRKEI